LIESTVEAATRLTDGNDVRSSEDEYSPSRLTPRKDDRANAFDLFVAVSRECTRTGRAARVDVLLCSGAMTEAVLAVFVLVGFLLPVPVLAWLDRQ
jgi:hypothetical protein